MSDTEVASYEQLKNEAVDEAQKYNLQDLVYKIHMDEKAPLDQIR